MTTIDKCIVTKVIECVPDLNGINDKLLTIYRQKFIHTCSKTHGFILDVSRVIKVNSCKISIYTGNSLIESDIEIKYLLPKVDQVVDGVVERIYIQGIILTVKNCMKVFIPTKTKSIHKVDIILPVKIKQIRFQKGKYDCIGELI